MMLLGIFAGGHHGDGYRSMNQRHKQVRPSIAEIKWSPQDRRSARYFPTFSTTGTGNLPA
jgi:hypothetical protein